MTKQENATKPYSILACCFADRSKAGEAMKELKAAKPFFSRSAAVLVIQRPDARGVERA